MEILKIGMVVGEGCQGYPEHNLYADGNSFMERQDLVTDFIGK